MCLFGTGTAHGNGWLGILSSVMVEVRELMVDEGRCGGTGRESAIVAIMVVVSDGPASTRTDAGRRSLGSDSISIYCNININRQRQTKMAQ